jgi:hypothetical protein
MIFPRFATGGHAREGVVIGAVSRMGWITRLVPPAGASLFDSRDRKGWQNDEAIQLSHEKGVLLLVFLVVRDNGDIINLLGHGGVIAFPNAKNSCM